VLGAPPTHSFEDISSVSKDEAHCELHDKLCQLPLSSLISFCGFSCKNLSKLYSTNGDGLSRSDVFNGGFDDGVGTTSSTFKSLVNVLLRKKHIVLVWENVPEILDERIFPTVAQAHCSAGYALAAQGGLIRCHSFTVISYIIFFFVILYIIHVTWPHALMCSCKTS
jgi:hypothetical protein